MGQIFEENWPEVKSDEELKTLILENPEYDPGYINLSTSTLLKKKKELVKNLLVRFEPYADIGFEESLKRKGEFIGRCWEMIVGVTFLEQGETLIPRLENGKRGPDIGIRREKINWIEAVSCTSGTGDDAVPAIRYGEIMDVPVRAMILRVGNAVGSKVTKYDGYVKDGIIKSDEPFIIAISKGDIPHVDAHPPVILRYLYGIGNQALEIPIDKNTGKPSEVVESMFVLQEHIKKSSGNTVEVGFFGDLANAKISGVIYCKNFIFNHPQPLGSDFVLLKNPNATNPLPKDFLSRGAEYVLMGDKLIYEDRGFIAQGDPFDYLEQ